MSPTKVVVWIPLIVVALIGIPSFLQLLPVFVPHTLARSLCVVTSMWHVILLMYPVPCLGGARCVLLMIDLPVTRVSLGLLIRSDRVLLRCWLKVPLLILCYSLTMWLLGVTRAVVLVQCWVPHIVLIIFLPIQP